MPDRNHLLTLASGLRLDHSLALAPAPSSPKLEHRANREKLAICPIRFTFLSDPVIWVVCLSVGVCHSPTACSICPRLSADLEDRVFIYSQLSLRYTGGLQRISLYAIEKEYALYYIYIVYSI